MNNFRVVTGGSDGSDKPDATLELVLEELRATREALQEAASEKPPPPPPPVDTTVKKYAVELLFVALLALAGWVWTADRKVSNAATREDVIQMFRAHEGSECHTVMCERVDGLIDRFDAHVRESGGGL